ncbi:MAG TPA: cation:proton antiporter, partial [Acidimicrobiales bacterium]|nr:cation:proton antiporter [Acidimicrobiales bacterium]
MGLTPDQVLGFVLLDIVIILVMARLFGKLANKLGQPAVVGEIVAGVVLGPSVLGATIFTWGGSWEQLHCEAAITAATSATPPAESITTCLFPPQAQGILSVLGQI